MPWIPVDAPPAPDRRAPVLIVLPSYLTSYEAEKIQKSIDDGASVFILPVGARMFQFVHGRWELLLSNDPPKE